MIWKLIKVFNGSGSAVECPRKGSRGERKSVCKKESVHSVMKRKKLIREKEKEDKRKEKNSNLTRTKASPTCWS